jgi:PleD family two-component response regulator
MKPLSILVIDDDEIQRLKFKRVCKETNLDSIIFEAENGQDALTILVNEKTPFDLIISDLNMPVMNGFDFLIQLKRNIKLKHIPVVIMSTSKNSEDLKRSYKLGVCGYFTKPFEYKEYANNVITLLEYWKKCKIIPA